MASVRRLLERDLMPAHHDGKRLRRRRHDGRWQKVERRAVLPPKWRAMQKARGLHPFISSLAIMNFIGQQYLDGLVAGLTMNALGEEKQGEEP